VKSLVSLRSIGAALVLLATPAGAHDFWIEPSSFRPAAGSAVSFHLRVGQQWQGDAFPRNRQRLVQFVLAGPEGTADIAGAEAVDPAGLARVGAPGLYLAGYASNNAALELEAAKFEEYLRLEGLEWAVAERARRGETAAGSHEVYARCAKSLLLVGGSASVVGTGVFDRELGLAFEIIPEQNPYALAAGGTLPVRVLYKGKPFAGALVVAMPKAHPESAVSGRSDSEGRVRLPLRESGVWMVKAVHLARLEGAAAAAEHADWQSLWASLTFELP
jgi:uncharacterized GH25 family protein